MGSLWATESDAPAAAEARAMLHEWPFERPRNWATLVNRPQTAAEEEALLASIKGGRPFGSDAWQKRTAARLGLGHTFRERGRPPKKPRAAAKAGRSTGRKRR